MDLFTKYLEDQDEFSRLDFFRERTQFIFKMLNRLPADRFTEAHRQDLAMIINYIKEHNAQKQFWRDCEVFFPIHELGRKSKEQKIHDWLLLLKLLVGIDDIHNIHLPDGFYRIKNGSRRVFRIDKRKRIDLTDKVLFHVNALRSDFYFPTMELFNRMIPRELYGIVDEEYDRNSLVQKIASSVQILRNYSEQLALNIENAISTIALLPHQSKASSYNLGLLYFGGIFINPLRGTELRLVENLIHEYYHNCSWLLWDLIAPEGCPSDDVLVRSPGSGRDVQAFSMVDALLINVGYYDFYNYLKRQTRHHIQQTEFVQIRLDRLQRQIPVLYSNLCEVVKKGTRVRRFIDFSIDHFRFLSATR